MLGNVLTDSGTVLYAQKQNYLNKKANKFVAVVFKKIDAIVKTNCLLI